MPLIKRMFQEGPALLLLALALSTTTVGCREPRTTDQLVAELRSPDPKSRRAAADDLRMDAGVPPQAIPALLESARAERDPPALGAMLITLGASGHPDAKPLIDAQIPTMDPDMRRWAGRALKYWMIETGQIPKDYAFPDGWPYGQPGFPPRLPD
jgi:hypothetical protein